MTATTYTRDVIAFNEGHLEIYPKIPSSPAKQGVQYVHGAGSDCTYCISPLGNQDTLTNMVAAAEFTGISGDNGGQQTWGNATSTARLVSNRQRLLELDGVTSGGLLKSALISASMGGIVSLNYARANPTRVTCIVSVIPVMNPEDIRANNRSGYGSLVNAAYGGSYVESTQGATRNPYTYRASSALQGIPMLIFYGLTDTLCLPAYTEAFAAADPTNRTLVALPTGHDFDTYAAVDHQLIVDFLLEHN